MRLLYEADANPRRIGNRLVWAVRSNNVANWATRAPCNWYISIDNNGILQHNSIYIFTHYLYEYNFGHNTLEYECVTSTTQSYFQNTIMCLNTQLCFAGFFIIITYDCRTLNFASVRSHLLSAIPLKTVSQMQKHPCKLSDIVKFFIFGIQIHIWIGSAHHKSIR